MNSPRLDAALRSVPSFTEEAVYCALKIRTDIHLKLEEAKRERSQRPTPAYVTAGTKQTRTCSAPNCLRPAHANSLCHSHYRQHRRGTFTGAPLREKPGRPELFPRERFGGAEKRRAVKAAVIATMGGKCLLCESTYHPDVYDFHHIFDKDSNVSDLLHEFKLWELSVELAKCVLLCANCHRAEHAEIRNTC